MPCSDGGPGREQVRQEWGQRAAWCAIMQVLEQRGVLSSVLDACDWIEAGITKDEVLGWWAAHKREDAQRRQQEQEDQKRKQVAAAARAKLSDEEWAALGLAR